MTLTAADILVRDQINRFYVEHQAAPRTEELGDLCGIPPATVRRSLERLEETGHLLLFPHSRGIWAAHPFSTIPSNYWVSAGDLGWWGNCGFCSLGIAAMTGAKAHIHAHLGAEQQPIELHIHGDHVTPEPLLLHIPQPIHAWHDEIIGTCGQVHFFNESAAIDDWCARHRLPRGQALPVAEAWKLARRWYGSYLDPGWQPRSNAQFNALLGECGLRGAFWRLPEREHDPDS